MTDVAPDPLAVSPSHAALMFPTLDAHLLARVEARGTRRAVAAGEVLVEAGAADARFFVVRSGHLEIVRPSALVDTMVVVHGPGAFTGEASLLLGRPSMMRARASEAGEVIELTRGQLLSLIQADSEIGDILMRAFVYRRVELIARGIGDVVLVGSNHSAATLQIREFLARNGHPFAYVDLDHEADVQALLDRFQITVADVPVLICRGDTLLRNPTIAQVAGCLGFNDTIERTRARDLIVVGAGPAGLAAAVYGTSEGLDVLVLESVAPGGQAGASSRIENYLGFPTGVSGQELSSRALAQAEKFGAEILIATGAVELTCDRKPYTVRVGDGPGVPARTVVIATGAEYRRPAIPNRGRFEGAGVYYSATFMEAQLSAGEEVVVVGGGNSAGQAAMFLCQTAARVHLIVRAAGLAESMSRYLIRRIEETPAVELHTRTELVDLDGDAHLERVAWRDHATGDVDRRAIRHVFLMTGAVPNTAWLGECLTLDAKGFVKTGADLTAAELAAARWPLARAPHLLETSLPGVFAVGDVRSGSVKRVASAVGEGSVAISFVHKALAE